MVTLQAPTPSTGVVVITIGPSRTVSVELGSAVPVMVTLLVGTVPFWAGARMTGFGEVVSLIDPSETTGEVSPSLAVHTALKVYGPSGRLLPHVWFRKPLPLGATTDGPQPSGIAPWASANHTLALTTRGS